MARRFSSVIGRLGMPTGDGRIISPGGLISRDLPLPLSWQRQSSEGHMGSVVVGRMESIQFSQDMVTVTGTTLDVPEAYEAEQLIEAGVIGPSMDLDDLDYVVDDQDRVIITSARVAGATLVSIPAFAEVSITLDPLPAEPMSEGGIASETHMDESLSDVSWLTASAAPQPPLEYFARPKEITPITVEGDRVFGYAAPRDQCHIGLPGCVTMPSSVTNYSHFLRKSVTTSTGETIPVGVLTVGGGHADAKLGLVPAMAHYDDVGAAVAKVNVGEDEFGLWVAGYVLPYADPVKVQQLADLDISVDCRRAGGNLELIAICAVNVPGFPVLKKVSFSMERGGQQSLIATFKVVPPTMQETDDRSGTARADWARARWTEAN